MENKLTIKQAENGFVCEWEDYMDDDNNIRVCKYLIEDKEDNKKKTMIELLIYVSEHFGISEDRYGKENLKVSFDRKGHKVD